jgi:hypothetical protein
VKKHTLLSIAVFLVSAMTVHAAENKVKVFILAGQSNMKGHGQVRSLDHLGHHPVHGNLLKKLKQFDGSRVVRHDVAIAWQAKKQKHGPLSVGWGFRDDEIGSELMFGTIMGEQNENPVLLIKTAWGGKDVFCDFRSPSAGEPSGDAAKLLEKEREKGREREMGRYYRAMVAEIRSTLDNLEKIIPNYKGQGYELAGMAWFQGWNDYCRWREAPGITEEHPRTLAAMFSDLRMDLKAPEIPIVIGEMG